MAELATLARPYSKAIFELAKSQGRLEAWDRMLDLLAVVANDANDALAIIGYSNQSGDTIRFVASVRTTEVAW